MGTITSRPRGLDSPLSPNTDNKDTKSTKTDARGESSSSEQLSHEKDSPKNKDLTGKTSSSKNITKDVFDRIAKSVHGIKNLSISSYGQIREKQKSAFGKGFLGKSRFLSPSTGDRALRLRGGAPSPTSNQSTISSLAPISEGVRPQGFVRDWESDQKETMHFKKHVIARKEFSFASTSLYSQAAFAFWEKPISPNLHPDIVEKIGRNGNLYRFEHSTGTLGIVRNDPATGDILLASFFRPKHKSKNPQAPFEYYRDKC